ncbi:MAG: hypothetical protein ACOYL6_09650 [Bacteriovoracaceae bacterium]
MKKIFIMMLLSFSATAAMTPFLKLKEDKLPLELVLMSESINEMKLTPDEKEFFSEHARNLNRHLKFLTKEQMYFVVKSEIYKNVLEKEFHGDFKIMKFTSIDIANVEKSYATYKKEYSPFARWLVESVISDFSELKDYPGFNQVKLDVPEKDPTLNLVRRKLSLLSPWLGAIAGLKASDFNLKMKRMMMKVISDLDLSTGIYKSQLSNKELDASDFITIQTLSNKKLPIKEKDDAPALEDKKEPTLEEESLEESQKAEKLTEALTAPENKQTTKAEDKKEDSGPRTWKPSEQKDKNGKIIPPPAPTWTPEN